MLTRSVIIAAVLAMMTITGCAVNRYVVTPYDDLTFYASKEVNPDAGERPSPIAIKIYQLTSRTTFDNLDFDAAFSNAKVVLSDELLSDHQMVLQPGERAGYYLELQSEAQFVAVVAAYRHIDRANWKLVLPVNGDWYHSHEVRLTANALRKGAPPEPEDEPPEPQGNSEDVSLDGATDAKPDEAGASKIKQAAGQ